jgi:predicted transglutaminase-like protease
MLSSELNSTPAHYTLEISAFSIVAGTLLGMLPAVAAIVGIIWYSILIWESKTVQGWFKRRGHTHVHKKSTHLPADYEKDPE